MAHYLHKNMERNGLSDTVQVVHALAENANLPEKVDVIVAEQFGYFAVYEQALTTWLDFRDRFLKPGGRMFPSKARLYVGLSNDDLGFTQKHRQTAFQYFNSSADNPQEELHGYDTTVYADAIFEQERLDDVDASKLHFLYHGDGDLLVAVAPPYTQNYETMRIEELDDFTIPLEFPAFINSTEIYELVCWFDYDFTGPGGTVTTRTGPQEPETHWVQLHLVLKKELEIKQGTSAQGELKVTANKMRGHDYSLELNWSDGQVTVQQWSMTSNNLRRAWE